MGTSSTYLWIDDSRHFCIAAFSVIVGRILRLSRHVELASQPSPARSLRDIQHDIPFDIPVHVFAVVKIVFVRVAQIADIRAQNRKEGPFVQNSFSFCQLQRRSAFLYSMGRAGLTFRKEPAISWSTSSVGHAAEPMS